MDKEMVNHPAHYGKDTPYETIKVIEAKATREEYIGFNKWTAFKYIDRAKRKGEEIEDYKKARWYLDNLVKFMDCPKSIVVESGECGVCAKEAVVISNVLTNHLKGAGDNEKS